MNSNKYYINNLNFAFPLNDKNTNFVFLCNVHVSLYHFYMTDMNS